jgi:hypothetical protein
MKLKNKVKTSINLLLKIKLQVAKQHFHENCFEYIIKTSVMNFIKVEHADILKINMFIFSFFSLNNARNDLQGKIKIGCSRKTSKNLL